MKQPRQEAHPTLPMCRLLNVDAGDNLEHLDLFSAIQTTFAMRLYPITIYTPSINFIRHFLLAFVQSVILTGQSSIRLLLPNT